MAKKSTAKSGVFSTKRTKVWKAKLEAPAAPAAAVEHFSFPSKSPCPQCGVVETRAKRTDGQIQTRECLAPICRLVFKVVGTKI